MDVKIITEAIFDRIKPYQLARHYDFAEMIVDGDNQYPACFCEDGEYKHVVNAKDWTEGVAYVRFNGEQNTRVDDNATYIGCQTFQIVELPFRLVVITKRTKFRPFDVGQTITSALQGQFSDIITSLGAISCDIERFSIETDTKTVLEDEFEEVKNINWDSRYMAVRVDFDLIIRGDANCLATIPCDVLEKLIITKKDTPLSFSDSTNARY